MACDDPVTRKTVELFEQFAVALINLAKGGRTPAERRLSSIAMTSPSAICRMESTADGPKAVIEHATSELASQFGYVDGELVGGDINQLIPSRLWESHAAHMRSYVDNPRSRHMGASGMSLVGRKKDGREVPVQVSLHPYYEEGVLHVACTVFIVPD